MDVMRPTVVWIEGKCYRRLDCDAADSQYHHPSNNDVDYDDYDRREEPAVTPEYACDELCDADMDVEQIANGKFRLKMTVASAYYGSIIGSKGVTKKRTESETRTVITIPRHGVEGDIVIVGTSKRDVISARTRLEVIVDSTRQKIPFTHFLSVPLTDSAIKRAFLDFRDDVLRECDGCRGLDRTLFQIPEKLHLTIGTMPLLSKEERDNAAELLEECNEKVVKPILNENPLKIKIKGLEYMNDDPTEVDVLYGKVDGPDAGKLQMLADQLARRFDEEGILQRQYERVKLHVTVMNTRFRQDESGVTEFRRRVGKPRESFDASKLLKLFGDYEFGGVFPVYNIHISQRHSTGMGGYYTASAKIDLPY